MISSLSQFQFYLSDYVFDILVLAILNRVSCAQLEKLLEIQSIDK